MKRGSIRKTSAGSATRPPISDPGHGEYRAVPRAALRSAVVWTPLFPRPGLPGENINHKRHKEHKENQKFEPAPPPRISASLQLCLGPRDVLVRHPWPISAPFARYPARRIQIHPTDRSDPTDPTNHHPPFPGTAGRPRPPPRPITIPLARYSAFRTPHSGILQSSIFNLLRPSRRI